MRLAVFFPASLFSAWACSYGLVDCLKRMGHEVTAVPVDPGTSKGCGDVGFDCDASIVSGPEHIGKFVPHKPNIPTVAWLHETVEREDYGTLDVDAIKRCADIVFCPAIQDEKYGFRYLPFGVDTTIFQPYNLVPHRTYEDARDFEAPEKTIDAAFIGLLYPKRQAFLAELKKEGVNLVTGNVQVLELGGVNARKTAELYAENIRKIKVFVNLPTLSQLAVTKIYEVLACGTPILTPDIASDHLENFRDLPVAFYEPNAKSLAHQLAIQREYYERGSSAQWFAEKTHANHRLELRCEKLIAGLKQAGAKAA